MLVYQDAVNASLGQNLQQNLPVEKTSPHVAPKTKKQPSRTMPSSKSPSSPLSKSVRSGVVDKGWSIDQNSAELIPNGKCSQVR